MMRALFLIFLIAAACPYECLAFSPALKCKSICNIAASGGAPGEVTIADPFTLTFDLTVKDVRTAAARAKSEEEMSSFIELNLRNGVIDSKQAAQDLKKLQSKSVRAPKHLTVIVSAHKGHLFESIHDLDDGNITGNSVIIMGPDRDFLSANGHGEFGTDIRNLDGLGVPLAGIGLPLIPLFESVTSTRNVDDHTIHIDAKLPDWSSGTLRPIYSAGSVSLKLRDGKPMAIEASAPGKRWDFTNQKMWRGLWIAQKSCLTQIMDGDPSYQIAFDLRDISEVSLPEPYFDAAHWLTRGEPVLVNKDRQRLSFAFDPSKSIASQENAMLAATLAFAKLGPVSPSPVVGAEAQDFNARRLDGSAISLKDLRGKVVLVDLWATWCIPCQVEMPYLTAAYKKFAGQGLEIVGVSMDGENAKDRDDASRKVTQFTASHGIFWPQALDDDKNTISRLFGSPALPFTVLIGRDGKILATDLRGSEGNLEPAIAKALAQ